MPSAGAAELDFRFASDQSLLVDCPPASIPRLLRCLELDPIEGVRNLHPAYRSVLVVFDPLVTGHDAVQRRLSAVCLDDVALPPPRTVDIEVRYGGLDGPDLDDVASLHGLAPHSVVELHTSALYTVCFLGFVPGFAYLSGLPAELATPRLSSPRTHVPAGSVGIAGRQTGVYPFNTPGGWRLIGRTSEKMFETGRAPMSLLQIGDHVRFIAG